MSKRTGVRIALSTTAFIALFLSFGSSKAVALPPECIRDADKVATHIHIRVYLLLRNDDNKENIPIQLPPYLGRASEHCILEMHTHEDDNVIHVESENPAAVFSIKDLLGFLEQELLMSMENHDGTPPLIMDYRRKDIEYDTPLENGMALVVIVRIKNT